MPGLQVIVDDDMVALVGSANLTNHAMESNLECGILICGGPQPRAIRDHCTSLYVAGFLLRLTLLLMSSADRCCSLTPTPSMPTKGRRQREAGLRSLHRSVR